MDKKLKVNIVEAETIRFIYEEYYRTLSPLKVVKALRRAEGLRTKTPVYETGKTVEDKKICTKLVYDTLNNPIYIGKVRHKKEIYDGEHKAIISQELWDKVHSVMAKDSDLFCCLAHQDDIQCAFYQFYKHILPALLLKLKQIAL